MSESMNRLERQRASDQVRSMYFTTVLPSQALPLRDHRVHGHGVLPGVFLIDLVLRSLRAYDVDVTRVELRRSLFRSPIMDDGDDAPLRVELFTEGGVVRRAIVQRHWPNDDTWTTHLECDIRPADLSSTAQGFPRHELAGSSTDLNEMYAFARRLGIEHGPFMLPEGHVVSDGVTASAELRLVGLAEESQEDFYAHPVLLDSATLVPLWTLDPALRYALEEPLIPLFIDRIAVRAPLPPQVRVHVLETRMPSEDLDTLESDFLLGPATGDEWLIGIFGFVAKRVRSTTRLKDSASMSPGDPDPDSTGESTMSRQGTLASSALELIERMVRSRLNPPVDRVSADLGFYELGLDSGSLLSITDELEDLLGTQLYPTLLFDHPTPAALAAHLESAHRKVLSSLLADDTTIDPTAANESTVSIDRVPARRDNDAAAPVQGSEAIAIVGMSGRFPGAESVAEFWQILADGTDCVTEVPATRWNWRAHFDAKPGTAGKSYSRWGGFVERPDVFDPFFFAISPRDAARMDPQERLFLETAWATFEDAGYSSERVRDELAGDVGVFAGAMWSEYQLFGLEGSLRGDHQVAGSWFSSIPNRVSYSLDLRGPSVAVDTACSSSLQAIHLACQSIRAGECRAAIAGGVNLSLHPLKYVTLSEMRMLSPTGRCHAFGERADGYVPGEGVGCVLLRPLQDALDAGDQILAVVRGSAARHGGHTGGFSVPSTTSQAALLREALEASDTDPASIGAIEAHGTGTSLGDPIEVAALTEVFGPSHDPGSCALGSVKSNVGHLESASGIAGVMKMILSLRNRMLLPTLHAEPVNPRLDLTRTPFRLLSQTEPWKETEYPRRAGVSSFGAGGHHVHVVLEEHRNFVSRRPRPPVEEHPVVVPLSARSRERLALVVARLKEHLQCVPDLALPDVAFTLQRGRSAMEHRCAYVVRSIPELLELLTEPIVEEVGDSEGHPSVRGRTGELLPETLDAVREWVRGRSVDWPRLWHRAAGLNEAKTVTLPTYPFLRRRCWVQTNTSSQESVPFHRLEFPGVCVDAASDGLAAQISLAANAPWFSDHVHRGQQIVPGAVLVGVLGQAIALLRTGPMEECGLRRVTLLAPARTVARDADLHLEVRAQATGEASRYDLVSVDEPDSSPLATAVIGQMVPPVEGAPLPTRHQRSVPSTEVYRQLARRGWEYGPSLRLISDVDLGTEGLTAHLTGIKGAASDILLLDAALQSCVLLLPEHGAPLPNVFRDVHLSGRHAEGATATVHRLRTSGSDYSFAVTVRGLDGQVLASVREVTMTQQSRSEVYLYAPRWAAVPLRGEPVHEVGCVMVVGIGERTVRQTAAAVAREAAGRVVAVHAGSQFRRNGPTEFTVRPSHPADLERVLEDLTAQGATPTGMLCTTFVDPTNDVDEGIEQVMALCQALIRRTRDLPASLPLVVAVRAGEPAALVGLARTVRLEQPAIRMRTVRIDEMPDAELVPGLLAELSDSYVTEHRETRLGPGGDRQVRAFTRLHPLDTRDDKIAPVRPSSSYLITGGTGRLGLITARWLLSQRSAGSPLGIVLLGRSELDAELRASLDALAIGPEVTIRHIQGDVADREVAERAVREAARIGPLRGVVHAAGVLDDGLLIGRETSALGPVWRTKVGGARALLDATVDVDLDFFLCFGSASAPLGSVGQAEYALANSALTELTAHAWGSGRHGRAQTIDWPLWREGGMDIPSGRAGKVLSSAGLRLLETDEALHLLPMILACAESNVAVLPGDAERIKDRLEHVVTDGHGSTIGVPSPERHIDSGSTPAPVGPAAVQDGADMEAQPLLSDLRTIMARLLELDADELDTDLPLEQFGIDSVVVMQALDEIEARFDIVVPPSAIQAHMTLIDVAGELAGRGATGAPFGPPASRVPSERSVDQLTTMPASHARPAGQDAGIAVVALAGAVGKAESAAQFWDALLSGDDVLAPAPIGHWSKSGDARVENKFDDPLNGAFLQESTLGRPNPFQDLPTLCDPQQGLLLSILADLVSASGYTLAKLSGGRTGVFIGATGNAFVRERLHVGGPAPADALTGALTSMTASWISKVLDVHGPCEVVDTACSSSLVAIHRACRSILSGECDIAVAGGVTLLPDSYTHDLLGAAGLLSQTGRTRVFDQDADGYTLGEGAGLVLLKRADEAYTDGDQVLAVIRGSAVNHDGRSLGPSAPNVEAQRSLYDAALGRASVSGDSIGHLEISGSANSFSDPLEVHAAAQALARHDGHQQACAISCLKSTTGALLHAGGVLALIKTVLALHTAHLPASIGVKNPHPRFLFPQSPFRLMTQGEDWESPESGPRRGAVTCLGLGGTNALVIVEEADREHSPRRGGPWLTWGEKDRATSGQPTTVDKILDRLDRGEVSAEQAAQELLEGL